jgi:hypothetical protein
VSPLEVFVVVAPVVVLAVVGTVLLTKRGARATQFLSSTIGGMPVGAEAGARVKCGVSVRRPGRMDYSFPLCEAEATARGLVLFGPMSGRMAEFCTGSEVSVEVEDGLMRKVLISSKAGQVVVAVRAEDATDLDPWLSRVATNG